MEHNEKYKNGFIYIWVKEICHYLYRLNLVEIFKKLSWVIASSRLFNVPKNDEKKIKNIAIDTYKLIKLFIVLLLWRFNINRTWATLLTFYLIITTLITYLKYHFWDRNSNNDYERNRRRFISMILSFSFIIIAFGYLYDVPFEYTLIKCNACPGISWSEALLYSTSNAFGGNYSSISSENEVGDWLSISQIIITFIYITLIFAKSLFNEGD